MFYELPASREGKVLKILFRKRKSTVLCRKHKIWISTLIPACIVCMAFIAGPHRYLLKYYYFNKYNVDAREAALNDVNRKYNQEFELMATDFEREKYGHREWFGAESVYDRAIYRQRWIFTMQDSEGRQFYTYLVRGSAFWIDGDFGGDYFSNCSGDTYGQVRIEEYLENEYGLSRYREDKSVGEPQKKADYVFVCSNSHADEIAEILTRIYFTETGRCVKVVRERDSKIVDKIIAFPPSKCYNQTKALFSYWYSICCTSGFSFHRADIGQIPKIHAFIYH